MNPICTCDFSESLPLGQKCVNRHEKLSSELDVGDASTTRKKVRKTPTSKSTIKSTRPLRLTTVINNYQTLHTDLKLLKSKNAKLNEKIVSLKASTNALEKQLKEEKDKNAKLTEQLSVELLEDYDYQCSVCHEVFIKPVLLNCSHMFCYWCINNYSKKNTNCPICRVYTTDYVHCLNMDNLIQKRMELMPAKMRLERKNLEESRENQTKLVVVKCMKVSELNNRIRLATRVLLPDL